MDLQRVPFRSPLSGYERQAETLLAAHRAADPASIDLFHRKHPRFLDDRVKWLPKEIDEAEIRAAALTRDDARLTIARYYDFRDWPALAAYVESVTHDGPVFEFESAVEAVVSGDLAALEAALGRNPDLVRARSTRVCCFDPPVHRAMLLHYVAANGVEGYRQKTPPNAVEIARVLLGAGVEPDALADMYGGQWTAMGLLVSSDHPAKAGLTPALTELLLDYGAAIDGPVPDAKWGTPLHVALTFGKLEAARVLAKRGARVGLAEAAGLGLLEDAARLLPAVTPEARHQAMALAAQLGHADIVRLLLDSGEDPNRYNPEGHHAHATPLHHAAAAGREAVVRLLVERGARLDVRDTLWHGTPLGWAEHCGQPAVAAYLRSLGN
jgi:Ankyrin repeats (3 copies)